MRNTTVSLEELNEVLAEETRTHLPLGRMEMRRWTVIALWGLRVYVVALLAVFALKFLQMAGLIG